MALSACAGPAIAAEGTGQRPPPPPAPPKRQKASKTGDLRGRMLLGVEGVFSHVKGVKSAVAGYHGGNAASAKYDINHQRHDRPCRIREGHL